MTPQRGLLRGAFSLVELLAVIALIGLLIALLIPAIQKVRASADNTQCINNMKQIGHAMHLYHDDYGHFPAGGMSFAYTGQSWLEPIWTTAIFPYIGQVALYRQGQNDEAPSAEFWGMIVPTYLCPSDPRENAGFSPPPNLDSFNYLLSYAPTSYVGVIGRIEPEDIPFPFGRGKEDGVFPQPQLETIDPKYINAEDFRAVVRILDITDGTSTTIMVGERPPTNPFNWLPNDIQDVKGVVGHWLDDSNRLWAINNPQYAGGWQGPADSNGIEAGGTPCPARSYFSPGDLTSFCHGNHFWSFHSGGGNWLMCDMSVRFMTYSAGTEVIPAMATIRGNEVIEAFD
jgi:type II secretory pathway pseudopilin PulG